MRNHNPDNERIKRKYLVFQKEARQQSEATIDAIAKSLVRFEEYTRCKDFKKFHFEQAIGFKRHLASQKNKQSDRLLSKSTINSTLNQIKRFFEWLSQQTGYKSRLNYSDAEYFNLSEKDVRIASATRTKKIPTTEQIVHVISRMPIDDGIALRNRAVIAFTLLTGARDSAIASMSMKHVDLIENCVYQDAREVSTKFSKTFTTYFFPIDNAFKQIVSEWVAYLHDDLLWGNDDPLFPSTKIELDEK